MRISMSQLKTLRKKHFLMQYDVCRYLDVSDVAYRTWELMIRRPSEKNYSHLKAFFTLLENNCDQFNDRASCLEFLDKEFVLDGEE